ncbi:GT2 family glycosyltransferase [Arenicella xantha]|uniref:GT2 family glycosyltransferase n=1 Tax=Arenicella xantha TaxID=644221 RepID=A0A395JGW7_9GAMM|nr:GT2 family glycosyltransferase [Arenicella xantha]
MVIPSYQRAEIVLDTIALLLDQVVPADEIIIVDQTAYANSDRFAKELRQLDLDGKIRWIRLDQPSIPHAMNVGLTRAKSDYVLFLDDDSSFKPTLIQAYCDYLDQEDVVAVVGQVVQPYEVPTELPLSYQAGSGIYRDLSFKFYATEDRWIHNCMAGNLLVDKHQAQQAGGFDQQFEGVAYRFETEFCRRLIRHSGQAFLFGSKASIDHLKLASGGTRSKVRNFLTSSSPVHSQGDYYFALRESQGIERCKYIAVRFFGSIIARFYVRNPWWIPVRLVGEMRGLAVALRKHWQSPIYLIADE